MLPTVVCITNAAGLDWFVEFLDTDLPGDDPKAYRFLSEFRIAPDPPIGALREIKDSLIRFNEVCGEAVTADRSYWWRNFDPRELPRLVV